MAPSALTMMPEEGSGLLARKLRSDLRRKGRFLPLPGPGRRAPARKGGVPLPWGRSWRFFPSMRASKPGHYMAADLPASAGKSTFALSDRSGGSLHCSKDAGKLKRERCLQGAAGSSRICSPLRLVVVSRRARFQGCDGLPILFCRGLLPEFAIRRVPLLDSASRHF
jgi:hypothetical protein